MSNSMQEIKEQLELALEREKLLAEEVQKLKQQSIKDSADAYRYKTAFELLVETLKSNTTF